ncbi:unnamed protein product [Meloidogyne enterolobii]|uniref:Uncharacterized protein n=1 Tax=Meloidogyne enterolobii TaxID=390850 RepID=A0ACB0ZDQ0_MELEN
MLSLPTEVQLDVLKYLNFNQLFSVKLTHFYFCNLINKYEGELAQIKFYQISIPKSLRTLDPYKFIKPEFGNFELTLSDQLKEKWQTAIDKSIPLFLDKGSTQSFWRTTFWVSTFWGGPLDKSIGKILVGLKTTEDGGSTYILEFSNLPKNIQEMGIARCLMEILFNCAFERAHFDKTVFNPEMVDILFDNDKTIPLKLNINHLYLYASNRICENLVAILDNLAISESFSIYLKDVDIPEQYIFILFDILINKGDKLHHVSFMFECELPQIYDLIVEYIATSRECSKIVSYISLHHPGGTKFKLSERAEEFKVNDFGVIKYTNYQIVNIHNPKEIFYFYINETKRKDIASSLRIKMYGF